MKAKTGRAIISYNGGIIFVKRTKYNEYGSIKKEYYTFPGGHLENDETYEEATIREVVEELGVKVVIKSKFIYLYNEELEREETFFLAEIVGGKIGTGNGPEFQNLDYMQYGKYEIVVLNKNEIENYNVLPLEVKNKIINEL